MLIGVSQESRMCLYKCKLIYKRPRKELNVEPARGCANMKVFTRCGAVEDSSPSRAIARTTHVCAGASFRSNTQLTCAIPDPSHMATWLLARKGRSGAFSK